MKVKLEPSQLIVTALNWGLEAWGVGQASPYLNNTRRNYEKLTGILDQNYPSLNVDELEQDAYTEEESAEIESALTRSKADQNATIVLQAANVIQSVLQEAKDEAQAGEPVEILVEFQGRVLRFPIPEHMLARLPGNISIPVPDPDDLPEPDPNEAGLPPGSPTVPPPDPDDD